MSSRPTNMPSRDTSTSAMTYWEGMTMTDDLNVVTLAAEMTALRHRLAQLNAERVTIEGQIAGYVDRIAAAAVAAGTPSTDASPAAAQTVERDDPMPLS